MRKLLTVLADALFPPRTEELLVRALSEKDIRTLSAPRYGDGWIALAPFQDKQMRALIHEAKFENNERAHWLLGTLLIHYLDTHPELQHAQFVPVPLARRRERARGYNQIERVLEAVGIHPSTDILARVKDTLPQTELSREARLQNVRGAFLCPTPESVYGKNIVLIDDVVTTGATLREAADSLRVCKPRSVTCLALAH